MTSFRKIEIIFENLFICLCYNSLTQTGKRVSAVAYTREDDTLDW